MNVKAWDPPSASDEMSMGGGPVDSAVQAGSRSPPSTVSSFWVFFCIPSIQHWPVQVTHYFLVNVYQLNQRTMQL